MLRRFVLKSFFIVLVLCLLVTVAGCTSSSNSDVNQIARPYRFSIPGWEIKTIWGKLFSWHFEGPGTSEDVLRYIALQQQATALNFLLTTTPGAKDSESAEEQMQKINDEINQVKPVVIQTLKYQITQVLISQGVQSDFLWFEFTFPPLSFNLTEPPHTLAVSPLDKISFSSSILLKQDLSPEEIDSIESQVDATGVSSVVLDLGGFGGTYPTFVDSGGDLRFIIQTAIHEWLHQYLAFKPLGFQYVLDGLGIHRDADAITMNETVANMASQELTDITMKKHYPQTPSDNGTTDSGDGFNFDSQMRSIRKNVDAMLASGKVEEAGQYMEQQREYLLTKGYYIRKLNQAYFAFNDQYADTPASTNPIGDELGQLRSQSNSLKAFLDTVSRLTNREQLISAITG